MSKRVNNKKSKSKVKRRNAYDHPSKLRAGSIDPKVRTVVPHSKSPKHDNTKSSIFTF